MKGKGIRTALWRVLIAAAISSACEKSPTVATPMSRPGSGPEPPSVRSVTIAGPDIVPLGGTAQFKLTAVMTDGSSRDVTNEAEWGPQWGAVAVIATPGVIAGHERGDATITGAFGGERMYKRVMVLPAGTFRLMGTVKEAGTPSGPVPEAVVEATTASGIRMTAHTFLQGDFVFYGLAGETRLRVTKNGYHSTVRTAVITDHTSEYNIELPLVAPRANVSGTYTLAVTAARDCRVAPGHRPLPEELRVRTYQANVEQTGPLLEMTLSGPNLRSRSIPGRVDPGRVWFSLGWTFEDLIDERPLLEHIPGIGFLAIGGGVSATVSANRLAGTLDGEIHIFESEAVGIRPSVECYSERHQFVLSK
jgi:hypothetical protein